MSTMPNLTRQAVEAAEPLNFDDPAPVVYHYPQFQMSATVTHRGRQITVTANDMNADQFCDLLDKRFGPPTANPTPAAMIAAPQATGAAPFCPIHTTRQMKASNYGGWFCTHSDPTTGEKCKQKVK
jgi:hypothetical protein